MVFVLIPAIAQREAAAKEKLVAELVESMKTQVGRLEGTNQELSQQLAAERAAKGQLEEQVALLNAERGAALAEQERVTAELAKRMSLCEGSLTEQTMLRTEADLRVAQLEEQISQLKAQRELMEGQQRVREMDQKAYELERALSRSMLGRLYDSSGKGFRSVIENL